MSADRRPVIGITADFESPAGTHPRFFLKEPYVRYVADAGAVPVILPFPGPGDPDDWSFLDGIVLSGSGPDITPERYGRTRTFFGNTLMDPRRLDLEMDILARFESSGKPILGICGGFQMMNVFRGGTLVEDLDSTGPGRIDHRKGEHPLAFLDRVPGLPSDSPPVNSFHHQGIDDLGRGLVAFARTGDRVIEGIWDPSLPYFVGVQWHPERQPSHPLAKALIDRFVKAAKESR